MGFPVLVILLLASGADAQTARRAAPPASEGAFYAESEGSLSARFFGTVRVRADRVEVLVSEGTIRRYQVRIGEREPDYRNVGVRAYLGSNAMNGLRGEVASDSVALFPRIAPGAEHPIGPLRLVLPRPRGSLEDMGLVLELTALDSTRAWERPEFFVFACSRYGAFVVPRARAAAIRTCGVREGTDRIAGAAEVRIPPTRQVCVEDPSSPNGMRPVDLIAGRPAWDTVVTRAGERRTLPEARSRVVGYVAGPWGLEPASVDARSGPQTERATILGHTYQRFGLPRAGPPGELVRIGEAHGASMFILAGSDVLRQPDNLFVLLPDCRFLSYVNPEHVR